MIWRWHFYAGLFVMPMVLILSLTGAIYLFKPQIDRWEERAFRNLPTFGAVAPNAQVDAALAAWPGASFRSYRLPEHPGDAAMVHLALPAGEGGQAMRDVFVSPQGRVLASLDPDWRIMDVVQKLHGQLLIGKPGSWLVELAASWAIVMILTGLYLWWPRGRGAAGVVWPRLSAGRKLLWRDLHAVTGFWVSGLAMILLLTGLPWADVWGSAFKAVRAEMGWVKGAQGWTTGGRVTGDADHAEHNHAAMMASGRGSAMPSVSINQIVRQAHRAKLDFPVVVTPPGQPLPFGGGVTSGWAVRSDTQDRPRRVTLVYDAMTGQHVSTEGFADKHVIDRVVGYGVAWHEGQLFGIVNQMIGVATALMLITLSATGFILWRRRKPADRLGAPPPLLSPPQRKMVVIIMLCLAVFLPLLALSLLAIWLLERLVLRRIAGLSRWLGLASARKSQ
ncbi:MAG: hypothetical protein RLZZ561_1069 [Pseudomonadota bacterium]